MSKIRADKIEYQEANFVVNLKPVCENIEVENKEEEAEKKAIAREKLLRNRLQNMIEKANLEAQEIIEQAKNTAQNTAQEIIEQAKNEALELKQQIEQEALKTKEEMISTAQEEIEAKRIEQAKLGYEEGHKDGQEKIQEELEEKISTVDEFCKMQFELKNKILKSLKGDIIEIIENISNKILYKELNRETLEKIINKTISLLEKKEDINVILSKKYAQTLLEVQNKALGEDMELSFEDLKNYKNFDISYNPKISDDTIIVENLKERFDASIKAQLDIIINQIREKCENEELDLIEQELKNEFGQPK